MTVIDSDAHVEEWSETFSDAYLDQEFHARRPRVVGTEEGRAYWVIEDHLYPRLEGRGCHILGTPTGFGTVRSEISDWKPEQIASIELRDVEQRTKDMNAEGIDLQVIYPTLFIVPPLTDDIGLACALARSYNSWIADVCARKPENFQWVATVCLEDIDETVRELRRVKKLGACGVMICGTVGERMLGEPRFRPFWKTAAELDLSVALHVGWSFPAINQAYDHLFDAATVSFAMPVLMGFVSVVSSGILDDYPNVRVGIFEMGCEWAPFWKSRMNHFYEFAHERMPRAVPPCKRKPGDYLNSGQIYIACEVDDDLLPYMVKLMGEEHLLFASDMPHSDRELNAAKILQDRGDLSASAKQKILHDNAIRFYGL